VERHAEKSNLPLPCVFPSLQSQIPVKSDARAPFSNFLLHLHPAYVTEGSLEFHRTFGLGGIAALLIVLQCITGILLRYYYDPFPGRAYESILMLQYTVLFGRFVRNMHHWSGVLLVMVTFLHLLRVLLTGAYRGPRKISWLVGLLILALVVLSNFTGYLLPWDQLAYWAITVSTTILQYVPVIGSSLREFVVAGKEVDANTLLVFYNFHTSVFPLLLLGLMTYHFWRVRKTGGVFVPETPGKLAYVPAFPNLVYREGVAALVVIAIVFSFSVFANAPLLDRANPNYSLNPTKAPWYFAGIQELLMHFHPLFAAFIIPLAVIVLTASLPYLKYDQEPSGLWFHSERGKRSAKVAAIAGALVTIAGIVAGEYFVDFERLLPMLPAVVSNGLIPFLILVGVLYVFYRYIVRRFTLSTVETVQALCIVVVTALVILTLTGIVFRGTDMALTIPWR
jgi:quinol-cytochrome oxidoreductase complex cytochrome b subunit